MEKLDEEMFINFGALRYSASQISQITMIEEVLINNEFKNKESLMYKLYQKGVAMSQYVIDLKVFEMAKSGDIKFIDKYEKMKRDNKGIKL